LLRLPHWMANKCDFFLRGCKINQDGNAARIVYFRRNGEFCCERLSALVENAPFLLLMESLVYKAFDAAGQVRNTSPERRRWGIREANS